MGVSVGVPPPLLPVYALALVSFGAPGYWAYDSYVDDYYWVPGTWAVAGSVGYRWKHPGHGGGATAITLGTGAIGADALWLLRVHQLRLRVYR